MLVVYIQSTFALLHTQYSRALGAGLLRHGREHGERGGVDTARVLHPDDDVVGSPGSFHQRYDLHPLNIVAFLLQRLHVRTLKLRYWGGDLTELI